MSNVLSIDVMSSYDMEDDVYEKEITAESLLSDFNKTIDSIELLSGHRVSDEEVEEIVSQESFINLVGSIMSAIVKMILHLIATIGKLVAGIVVWIAKKIAGKRDEVSILKGSIDSLKNFKDAAFSVSTEDDGPTIYQTVTTANKSFKGKEPKVFDVIEDKMKNIEKAVAHMSKVRRELMRNNNLASDAELDSLLIIGKSINMETMADNFKKATETMRKISTMKFIDTTATKYLSKTAIHETLSKDLGFNAEYYTVKSTLTKADVGGVLSLGSMLISDVEEYAKDTVKITKLYKKDTDKHGNKVASLSKKLVKLDKIMPDFKKKHAPLVSAYQVEAAKLRKIRSKHTAALTSLLAYEQSVIGRVVPELNTCITKLTNKLQG